MLKAGIAGIPAPAGPLPAPNGSGPTPAAAPPRTQPAPPSPRQDHGDGGSSGGDPATAGLGKAPARPTPAPPTPDKQAPDKKSTDTKAPDKPVLDKKADEPGASAPAGAGKAGAGKADIGKAAAPAGAAKGPAAKTAAGQAGPKAGAAPGPDGQGAADGPADGAVEPKAAAPAKAAAPGAGARAGGGGGGGGKATLKAWKSEVSARTSGMPDADLTAVKKGPEKLGKTAAELEQKRKGEKEDPLAKARAAIPDSPKVEDPPPPPPPDPVPAATRAMKAASRKRLSDQSLPALTRSPGHPKVDGGKGHLPSLTPKILTAQEVAAQNEAREKALAAQAAAGEKKPGEKNLEKLQSGLDKKVAPPAVSEPQAITFKDPGRQDPPPLGKAQKEDVLASLAVVLASKDQLAETFVQTGLAMAYPGGALLKVAPQLGDPMKSDEKAAIQEHLQMVAEEAGIAAEALSAKVTELQAKAKEEGAQADAALGEKGREARDAAAERGGGDQRDILQASKTVGAEIDAKQQAATGSVDPKAVEARRDRMISEAREEAVLAKAEYRQAVEKRKRELGSAGDAQAKAYEATAAAEARAVRSYFTDETTGRLEAKPSLDWGYREAKAVREKVELLRYEIGEELKALEKGVDAAVDTAREAIREWAAKQLGEERSWWDRLVDMFRDWLADAQDQNAAFKKAEAKVAKDELVGDLAKLDEIQRAIASGNKEAIAAATAGLSAEEKIVVATFFQSGGNSVQAVATGMIFRLQQRRVPKMVEEAKKKALELGWDDLDKLGRAESPSFDSRTVARQVHDAVAGIGTNEQQIYDALNGLTPTQAAAVRKAYQAAYQTSIEEDLKGDLSGEEEKRALSQLSGDHIGAAVSALRYAVEGMGTDEATIMSVLRGKTEAERAQIKKLYKERYNVDLDTDLKGDLNDREKARADALLAGNTDLADAIGVEDALKGGWFGPDTAAAEGIYTQIQKDVQKEADERGLTTAEMNAELRRRNQSVGAAYDTRQGKAGALASDVKTLTSGPDRDLLTALHDVDHKKIDAARMRQETGALFVTSDDKVNSILEEQRKRAVADTNRDYGVKAGEMIERARTEKWSPERLKEEQAKLDTWRREETDRRAKENMTGMVAAYDAARGFGGGLRLDIARTTMGNATDKAWTLLEQNGKLTPAQRVRYAVRGEGTHDADLKAAFIGEDGKPLSKEDLEKARSEYRKLTGRELDDDVLDDVSGRDHFDMTIALEGRPETPEDMMKLLRRKRQWEEDNAGFGDYFADTERGAMEFSLSYAQGRFDEYQKLKAKHGEDHPATREARQEFERAAGHMDADIGHYRKGVDRITDYAATVAELTVVVAGVVLGAIFTGGTASAAVLATWAAATAAAAATAGIITRAAFKGGAYGWEDLATDAAVGVVDVGASLLTFGMSKALLATGKLARLAKGPLASRLVAHFLAEGIEGAAGALPAAFTGSFLNDASWEGGNPLESILLGTAMGTGGGFLLGGGLGSLGGIKAPAKAASAAVPHMDLPGKVPGAKPKLPDVPRAPGAPVKAPDAPAVDAVPHGKGLPDTKAPDLDAPTGKAPDTAAPTGKASDADVPDDGPVRSKGAGDLPKAPDELQKALPLDLRGRLDVHADPDLPGRTVRVHYDVDERGLVKNVHLRAGPAATAADIKLHARTARLMRRYGGLSGRVFQLVERLNVFIAKYGDPPVGSRAWEARFELDKLPRVLQQRAAQVARGGLSVEDEIKLHLEILDLEEQLARHARTLADMDVSAGTGYVAANSDPAVQENIGRLLADPRTRAALGDRYPPTEEGKAAFLKDFVFRKKGDGYVLLSYRSDDVALNLTLGGTDLKTTFIHPVDPTQNVANRARIRQMIAGIKDAETRQKLAAAYGDGDKFDLDRFFADYQLRRSSEGTLILAQMPGRNPPVALRLRGGATDYDLSGAELFEPEGVVRTYGARKTRAYENRQSVVDALGNAGGDQPFRKALHDRRSTAGWTAEDAAMVLGFEKAALWADGQFRSLDEAGKRHILGLLGVDVPEGALPDSIIPSLLKGLPANYSEPAYDAFRTQLRELLPELIFAGTTAPGAKRRQLVDQMLDTFPDDRDFMTPAQVAELARQGKTPPQDVKTKGEQLSAYRRAQMSRSGEIYEVKQDVGSTIQDVDGNKETRLGDGVVEVKKSLEGQGGPKETGLYSFEDKAGASFNVEQAANYSKNLEQNGEIVVGTSKCKGKIFFFDSEERAISAWKSYLRHPQKHGPHPKMFLAYLDADGNIKYVEPSVMKKLKEEVGKEAARKGT